MRDQWPMNIAVAQADSLLWIPADDEAIILHHSLTYYELNHTAKRIWELLALPQSSMTLQRLLCLEYNVDLQTCGDGLAPFLADLLHCGLLITAEGPGEPMAPRTGHVLSWQVPRVRMIED